MNASQLALPGTAAPAVATDCFHCGLPVRESGRFRFVHSGQAREYCCLGCASVAGAILDAGLGSYYAHRDGKPVAPSRNADASDLELYDRADYQAGFVTDATDGLREAALVIEGIQCPACVWLIEQRLRQIDAVAGVTLDYATRRARVRWDVARRRLSEIVAAIGQLGYVVHPDTRAHAESIRAREQQQALWRLFIAGFGMMQVMMFAYPSYIAGEGELSADVDTLLRWASLLLTVPVVLISAQPFLRGAWRDLRMRRLGMDVPIALAITITFVASTWATLAQTGEVWFDSLTMFVFFLLGARYLELLVRNNAARQVEALTHRTPASAVRLAAFPAMEPQEEVASAALEPGEHVLITIGALAPADGTVVQGRSAFDESALTGESQPVDKAPGSAITSGTINRGAAVVMRVDRVGAATWLAGIARMVEQACVTRPQVVREADRYAGVFVGAILLLALGTVLAWWPIDPHRGVIAAIAVLVVTCPCALSLAAPVALLAAGTRLGRHGVLVPRLDAIEKLPRVHHVVFDKTGSLTYGALTLASIELVGALDRDACLRIAATLEQTAAHPMAVAIRSAITTSMPQPFALADLLETAGAGVEATLDGVRHRIGSASFIVELAGTPAPALGSSDADDAAHAWLGNDHGWLARFSFGDGLRADAPAAVQALREQGVQASILSGDASAAVNATAQALRLEQFEGGLTPLDKRDRVALLQQSARERNGLVAMVGDGVNDAPVLAQADVSIAMASGTALAHRSADIVLLDNRLSALPAAFDTARRTARVLRQNLAWAFAYNLATVPLASLGLISPWIAGAGMAASSLLVVVNAARIARA